MSGREVRDDELFALHSRARKLPRSPVSRTLSEPGRAVALSSAPCHGPNESVKHEIGKNVNSASFDVRTMIPKKRSLAPMSERVRRLPSCEQSCAVRGPDDQPRVSQYFANSGIVQRLPIAGDKEYADYHPMVISRDLTHMNSSLELPEGGVNCDQSVGQCSRNHALENVYENAGYQRSVPTYLAPRKRGDVMSQFDRLPWRQGRSAPEDKTLNGVLRLTEFCLSGVRRQACAGLLGDMDCLPDDIAIEVLSNVTEDVLVDLEQQNPTRQLVLDACWTNLCDEDELPEDVRRWRTFVEQKRANLQRQLEDASRRLRRRYSEQVATLQHRAVSHTRLISAGPERRRRLASSSRHSSSRPNSAISRLRNRLRRERSLDSRQKRDERIGRNFGSGPMS